MSTYMVRNLDQAKLLTDPFKLQLLERFSGQAITTMQVAEAMGEKAPRLYRHVDALVAAGLLELVREQPKRGTVERYYRTIASRFELDPDLFTTTESGVDEVADMMHALFRETESELLRLHHSPKEELPASTPNPIVMRLVVRGNQKQVGRLMDKLNDLIAECQELADDDREAENGDPYAGLFVFYPRIEVDAQ